jgi:hypothetical protein
MTHHHNRHHPSHRRSKLLDGDPLAITIELLERRKQPIHWPQGSRRG